MIHIQPFRKICRFLLCLSVFVYAGGLLAQDAAELKLMEYRLKASWLTKFIKYVDWSDKKTGHAYTIAIVGADPFVSCFTSVEGKPFLGKTLQIRRYGAFHEGMSLGEADLLFISKSERNNLSKILDLVESRPIITVSEIDHFTQMGGMIYFMPLEPDRIHFQDSRIRYHVNLGNAYAQNLRITSPLLRYADKVFRKASGGR